jgi:hypothetical protein
LITGKLINGFLAFTILTIYGMVITYIAQIKSQLVQLMNENINLFDQMSEGLVVVSEED